MAEIILDSTKSRSWLTCKRKFYYSHLLHLESAGATAVDLVYGSVVHECLEFFENRMIDGFEKDDALVLALGHMHTLTLPWETDITMQETAKKNKVSAIRLLIWYAEQYHPNGLEGAMVPVANEIPFRESFNALVKASGMEIDTTGIPDDVMVSGRLDSIVEGPGRGEYWIRERKTSAQPLSDFYWIRYSPDIQTSIYPWVGRALFPDLRLKGVMMEAYQIGGTFIRMERRFLTRWPALAEETVRTLAHVARDMVANGVGTLSVSEMDMSKFIMNEGGCMNAGLPCTFRGICNEHPKLRAETIATKYKTRTPWNPLDGMDPCAIASLSNRPQLHIRPQ